MSSAVRKATLRRLSVLSDAILEVYEPTYRIPTGRAWRARAAASGISRRRIRRCAWWRRRHGNITVADAFIPARTPWSP